MASSMIGKTCLLSGVALVLGTVAHAVWKPKVPTEVRVELPKDAKLVSVGKEKRVQYKMTFYNDWPHPIRLVGAELC